MKSSALHAIFWVFLISCNVVYTQPQTKPARKEAASRVSGKVTIKGKGVPGIVVSLREADFGSSGKVRYKTTTGEDGNYRITNVGPGTYRAQPVALAFVSSESEGKVLLITEGETVEGIDFALSPGGVITGRVVDSDGLPLIEEQIMLLPGENTENRRPFVRHSSVQTDDRGIYRMFGIPPGKYRIALGQGDDISAVGGFQKSSYKQTFSPGVTDPSKASVIEVSEGSVATNVDITVGRSLPTFAIRGRVIDGETQRSVPNVRIGLRKFASDGSSSTSWGTLSNSQGEFKLEATPGKYSLFVQMERGRALHGDEVPFEIIDQDVAGLMVKISEVGGTLSGMVVLEGRNDKSAVAILRQVLLHTYVHDEGNGRTDSWGQPTTISSDGSFRVNGLKSGLANFSFTALDHRPLKGLTLMRIEREGVAQSRGVEIKDREQVTGVRLVVSYGNGAIRGIIKLENGEIPANARFSVFATNSAIDPNLAQGSFREPPEVDARGHFLIEGLPAGTYEVRVNIFIPGSSTRPPPSVTQSVNVSDDTTTEVTLTLNPDLSPNPGNP